MGAIRATDVHKLAPRAQDLIIQLGGPGMRIGMGGGTGASSPVSGTDPADLASVQRDNAEMQRRVQEVINYCCCSPSNPLRSIHDVGAGGIGTAIAELARPLGAKLDLAAIPVVQDQLNPAEILCNEAQERYVAFN